MLYAKYELVLENISSGAAWVYSKAVNVKDFRQLMVYVKENNVNAVMYKIEGRAAQHAKAGWQDILAATDLVKNADAVIESESHTLTTQAECLDLPWVEIRVGILDCGATGRVYAWVNKRRR